MGKKEYELYIFDLDGTLYYQKKLRIRMFFVLLEYYIIRPHRIKELFVLIAYRKLKEKCTKSGQLKEVLPAEAAEKVKMSKENVRQVVKKWMMEKPLYWIRKYRDEDLYIRIQALRKSGKRVVVYSDYPTNEKLKALEITVDASYCGEDENIDALKPNPKGIEIIIREQKIPKEKCIMIGDRFEKDGQAAKSAGIDWVILNASKKKRSRENLLEGIW